MLIHNRKSKSDSKVDMSDASISNSERHKARLKAGQLVRQKVFQNYSKIQDFRLANNIFESDENGLSGIFNVKKKIDKRFATILSKKFGNHPTYWMTLEDEILENESIIVQKNSIDQPRKENNVEKMKKQQAAR